jgi:hypothetical protein
VALGLIAFNSPFSLYPSRRHPIRSNLASNQHVMIPDPYKKTLRIPVRLMDGNFQLFHGGPLPKIKTGAIADLVIESHFFEDSADVNRLEVHKTITIWEKDTMLMARLSTNYCEDTQGLIENIKMHPEVGYPIAFAPIRLKEDLVLNLVSGKPARLNDCLCSLPSINNLEAVSVNHAFTLASRHYETRRRSFGGNVFNCVYFQTNEVWQPLKDLRLKHELEFESEITRRNEL